MINLFGRVGIPAMSQTPADASECVVCLPGCTLLFIEEPPLYYICVTYCLQHYCD